jgi:predicted XRE-type DNA-binding protein
MSKKLKTERSSGNVFLDIGFTPDEAQVLMLRAQLMSQLRDIARSRTRRKAAKRLGVSSRHLNHLLHGRIGRLDIDVLVSMLRHAGMHVELRVRKAQ